MKNSSLNTNNCLKHSLFKIVFYLSLIYTNAVCAQQSTTSYAPQSPNARGGISSTHNVDLYTGKLTYTAPVAEFEMAKMKFPLELKYTSFSGIKVQDVPTNVGLGWNISTGGEISRVMRNLPDEETKGYCGSGNVNLTSSTVPGDSYDFEPDDFHFSFMGFSGVFRLNQSGIPVLQSSYGLKVTYSPFDKSISAYPSATSKWILQDQDGNQYFFGEGNSDQSNVSINQPGGGVITKSFVSAWHISKIVTADNQTINFAYGNETVTFTNYINIYRPPVNSNPAITWNENITTTISQAKRLSSIQYGATSLIFYYDMSREDLTGTKALTRVYLYENGKPVQKVNFHYSYFISDSGGEKRLRLDGISRQGSDYQITYIYKFNYNNSVNLPVRSSIQTDYLGYYNSNNGTSNIQGYNGGDKTPNHTRTAANVLTSVVNKDGGEVQFITEPNTAVVSGQVVNQPGLRIKTINQVLNGNLIGTQSFSYSDPATGLSSGQLYYPAISNILTLHSYYFLTIYHHHYSEAVSLVGDLFGNTIGYSWATAENSDGSKIRYHFTNFNDYADISDNKEWDWVNGQFKNASDYGITDQFPRTSYAFARGKTLTEEYLNNTNAVVKKTTNNWALSTPLNDCLAMKWYFDYDNLGRFLGRYHFFTQDLLLSSKKEEEFSSSGTLTLLENYTYTNYGKNNFLKTTSTTRSNGSVEKSTYRYPFEVLAYATTATVTSAFPYNYLVKNNILNKPVEVLTSVTTNGVENVISAEITEYGPSGNGTVKPYKVYKINTASTITPAGYIPYSVSSNSSSETVTKDPRLYVTDVYSSYDSYGNLRTVQNPFASSGVNEGKKSYIWGYNGQHMIAEVTNASYDEVFVENFEETNYTNIVTGAAHSGSRYFSSTSYPVVWTRPDARAYTISYWYLTGGIWKQAVYAYTGSSYNLSGGTAYDDILIAPADAQVTTSAYKTGVGMTSITDTKGATTYYEYDNFNRLKTSRDSYGKVIKSFAYHNIGFPILYQNNEAKTVSVARNNCSGPEETSNPITYTVAIGTCSSPFSQLDANQQAENRAFADGQDYANANGYCYTRTKPVIQSYAITGTGQITIQILPLANCTFSVSHYYDVQTSESGEGSGGSCTSSVIQVLSSQHAYQLTVTGYSLTYPNGATSDPITIYLP